MADLSSAREGSFYGAICKRLLKMLRMVNKRIRGGFVEHLHWTLVAQQSLTKIISLTFVN